MTVKQFVEGPADKCTQEVNHFHRLSISLIFSPLSEGYVLFDNLPVKVTEVKELKGAVCSPNDNGNKAPGSVGVDEGQEDLCNDRQVFQHAHHDDEVGQNLVARLDAPSNTWNDNQSQHNLGNWEVVVGGIQIV